MYRILMVMICALAGCQTVAPLIVLSDHPADFDLIVTSGHDAAVFDLNDPDGQQQWRTELSTLEISRTPRGSLVRVVDADDRQFLGTLMRASHHKVQLRNCLCKEVAPSLQGSGQLKLSHVPNQTFEIATITGFTMFSPPPANFDPEKLHPSRGDSTVQAIVLRSGRHLPWVDPPAPNSTQNVAPNEVSDRIAAALPGAQVSLIDESGQRVNGIVVSTAPESLELMNCLIRERVPGADGPAHYKTSHLPFQHFPPSSLASFAIVSPPPPDFSAPDVGVDCEEYIVSEFIFQSGRRQAWAKPENDEKPSRSRFPLTSNLWRR